MFPVESESSIHPQEYKQVRDFSRRMARIHLVNMMMLLERRMNLPYSTDRRSGFSRVGPKVFSLNDPAGIGEYLSSELKGLVVEGGNETVDVKLNPDRLIVLNPVTNRGLYLDPNIQPWHHPFVNTVYFHYERAELLRDGYNQAFKDDRYDFEHVTGDAETLIRSVNYQAEKQGLTHPVRDIPLKWTELLIY